MRSLAENRNIIPILAIMALYFAIRIPLLDKPLQHDEIYYTSTYLHSLPSFQSQDAANAQLNNEFGWRNDWKRFLPFRLPSVYLFYYFWIRIFSDSEISIHIPSIFLGLIGSIFYYRIGLLIFNPRVSLFAFAATTFSISHIGLSTSATYSIFEFCIFGATLLSLARFLLTKNRSSLWLTMVLNIFGILIFYHYFSYLFLQTLIFWFNRTSLRVPRYYFVCAAAALMGFAALFFYFYLNGGFDYGKGFWIKNNLATLLSVAAWLPFSFIADRVIGGAVKLPVLLFCGLLIVLFFTGAIKTVSMWLKDSGMHSFLRLVMLLLFILPFTLYLIGGFFGINVGHGQNFFYLLSVYYLFVFYGLEKTNIHKKIRTVCRVAIIAVFILFAVLGGPILLKYKLPEKEMVKIAATANADFGILVAEDYLTSSYYARKYGISDRSFLFPYSAADKEIFLQYLQECVKKKPYAKRFVIIRKLTPGEGPLSNSYGIGNGEFKLVKTDLFKYDYFRFRPMQAMIARPLVLEVNTFQLKES